MITLNTVTARQSDRRKQKPIRRSGKDNAQPHTSECGDTYPNLGSCFELGDVFWIRVHWFVSTMLFTSPPRQKGSKLPNQRRIFIGYVLANPKFGNTQAVNTYLLPYLNPMPNNRQARHIQELAAKHPYNIYCIVKMYRVHAYALTNTK